MSDAPQRSERSELSLDIGWRIGEQAFSRLAAIIRERDVTRILEFGSGASTVRLAQEFPNCRIVSVEHDERFAEQTRELAERFGVADRINVEVRPLRFRRFAGRLCFTYGYDPDREGTFDLVIVDGPPGYLITGREACLYIALSSLALGATVVLDDHLSWRQRITAKRWRSVFGDAFRYEAVDVGNGLLFLHSLRRPEPRVSVAVLMTNVIDLPLAMVHGGYTWLRARAKASAA